MTEKDGRGITLRRGHLNWYFNEQNIWLFEDLVGGSFAGSGRREWESPKTGRRDGEGQRRQGSSVIEEDEKSGFCHWHNGKPLKSFLPEVSMISHHIGCCVENGLWRARIEAGGPDRQEALVVYFRQEVKVEMERSEQMCFGDQVTGLLINYIKSMRKRET